MPLYETTVVLDSTLEESAIEDKLRQITDHLAEAGATEIRQDRRGVRKLAYQIKGSDGEMRVQADYTFILYEAPGNVVTSIETELRIDEAALRYMTVRYDHEPPAVRDFDAVADDDDSDERDRREDRPRPAARRHGKDETGDTVEKNTDEAEG